MRPRLEARDEAPAYRKSGREAGLSETSWPGGACADPCVVRRRQGNGEALGREPLEPGKAAAAGGEGPLSASRCGRKAGPLRRE